MIDQYGINVRIIFCRFLTIHAFDRRTDCS